MQTMLDVKRAVFEPADVAVIRTAMTRARELLSPEAVLPAETQAKLAKVIISIARQKLRSGRDVVADAIAIEAASFIHQLRSLSLLA